MLISEDMDEEIGRFIHRTYAFVLEGVLEFVYNYDSYTFLSLLPIAFRPIGVIRNAIFRIMGRLRRISMAHQQE